METARLIVESLIAVIGLYLAHSFRRSQRLTIAEKRLGSYQALWEVMEVARPTRMDPADGAGPLLPAEAADLYKAMTHWYYSHGQGMLLTDRTKTLYLATKKRLGGYSASPPAEWRAAGKQRIDELSLLRTQMKRDLDIYGVFYAEKLDENGESLLLDAHIDPERWMARPWFDVASDAVASLGWRLRRLARGPQPAPEAPGAAEPTAP
jgi:hypothetical protein